MSNIKFLFFLPLYFTCLQLSSQNISGKVLSDSTSIARAQLILKKKSTIIAYQFTDEKGSFLFQNIKIDSLELEVTHLNYISKVFFLTKPFSNDLKLELFENTKLLQEVIIKGDLPIYQKKDTIVYNPKHYLDGSERVVEDLLKKLPGISVNDVGKIFFKGKEIESLMLDGDDLFNSRYTIGSRNIDVNEVKSVEAIENFNKNKVLHKITTSDKVALNLKLKNKQKFTSRLQLENDFTTKYDNTATSLLLHKKAKGFSILNTNNLGEIYDTDVSLIDNNYQNYPLISQGSFPVFLSKNNSILNETFQTNNSFKLNISEKSSFTIDLATYKDNIKQQIDNTTKYQFNDQNFEFVNSDSQIKKPETIATNTYYEYYNGKDIQVNTHFILENKNSLFTNNAVNNSVPRASSVYTDEKLLGGKAEITKKLSDKSAINFSALLSQKKTNQNFLLQPSIEIYNSISIDNQLVDLNTNSFVFTTQFYRNFEKFKLVFTNKTSLNNDELFSRLDLENSASDSFVNTIDYKNFTNELRTKLSFTYKKFRFSVDGIMWLNKLQKNNQSQNHQNLLFETNVKYAITKKQELQLFLTQSIETPLISKIFNQSILNSYSSLITNGEDFDNIKNTQASLNYSITDLYNTFYFRSFISFSYKNKDYYDITTPNPVLISNQSILIDQKNTRTTLNLSIQKFIPFIKINFKYNTTFMFSTYYNFLEDSTIREIDSKIFNNEIILFADIIKGVSVNNKFNIDFNFFKMDSDLNKLTQLKNEFKINYIISQKLSLNSSLSTIISDTKKNQKYNFIGFEILYKLSKPNLEIYFTGQNLINHKRFVNTNISDFSVSSFSYNLQERNILLGLRFKLF